MENLQETRAHQENAQNGMGRGDLEVAVVPRRRLWLIHAVVYVSVELVPPYVGGRSTAAQPASSRIVI
jgi:hypothetical protein